jgi:hypothetical protein
MPLHILDWVIEYPQFLGFHMSFSFYNPNPPQIFLNHSRGIKMSKQKKFFPREEKNVCIELQHLLRL